MIREEQELWWSEKNKNYDDLETNETAEDEGADKNKNYDE